jgi:tetratricopeptide (TPR) repeat protein
MNTERSRTSLWIIVAVALASALLVACGGGEPDTPTAPPTAPPTPTPAASPTPSASEYMEMGLDYRDEGQLDEAAAAFEAVTQLDPDFVEAHYNLGLTYADLDEFELAIAEQEAVLELAPDLAEAHNVLGMAYYGLERFEEAIAAYEEAIQLDPDLADAHFNLGHAYAALEQHAQALAAYQEAARLSPDDFETHHNIGLAYIKQGLVNEAIAAWEKAISINPDFAETHYALGLAYTEVERYAEAVTELNEALRLEPERDSAYKHLGVAYYALRQDEQSIAAFETYLRLQPDDPVRATIEATIAQLQGETAEPEPGNEYRNAPGGYALLYPDGLAYVEDGTLATFAPNESALELEVEEAVAQGPVVMFDISPLTEVAGDFDLAEDAAPEEILLAMAENMEAELIGMETGMLGGYPGALAEITGTYEGTAYIGGLGIIVVEERVSGALAMSPPEQWSSFHPAFTSMFFSLSFFEPE